MKYRNQLDTMSMRNSVIKVELNGVGFVLFLVFMILKLTGVIDWSWWWITAPLWMQLAYVIIALVAVLCMAYAKYRRLKL